MCLSHSQRVLSKSTHQLDYNVPNHIPNGFFESLWENWTKLRILFDYIEINLLGTFWSDWWVLLERTLCKWLRHMVGTFWMKFSKNPLGSFKELPSGYFGGYFWKILTPYPPGKSWVNCFRTHHVLSMDPLGNWPLAPSGDRQEWPLQRDVDVRDAQWCRFPTHGQNGLFLAVMATCWWAQAVKSAKDVTLFKDAVGDLNWVIQQLIRTRSGDESPPNLRYLSSLSQWLVNLSQLIKIHHPRPFYLYPHPNCLHHLLIHCYHQGCVFWIVSLFWLFGNVLEWTYLFQTFLTFIFYQDWSQPPMFSMFTWLMFIPFLMFFTLHDHMAKRSHYHIMIFLTLEFYSMDAFPPSFPFSSSITLPLSPQYSPSRSS